MVCAADDGAGAVLQRHWVSVCRFAGTRQVRRVHFHAVRRNTTNENRVDEMKFLLLEVRGDSNEEVMLSMLIDEPIREEGCAAPDRSSTMDRPAQCTVFDDRMAPYTLNIMFAPGFDLCGGKLAMLELEALRKLLQLVQTSEAEIQEPGEYSDGPQIQQTIHTALFDLISQPTFRFRLFRCDSDHAKQAASGCLPGRRWTAPAFAHAAFPHASHTGSQFPCECIACTASRRRMPASLARRVRKLE